MGRIIYITFLRAMPWTRTHTNFIKAIANFKTKRDIIQASQIYLNDERKTNPVFHESVLKLYKIKTDHDQALETLPIMYKAYKKLYKIGTRKQRLSEVRTQAIKPFQSDDLHAQSNYEQYFNLTKKERIKIVEKYKSGIKQKNENKIQIDVEALLQTMNDLILSKNRYDKLLALMLATGARPIEIFAKNEFSLVEQKSSWLRVDGLAKKREGQVDWTTRPVVNFTPQLVIDQVASIRRSFGKVIIIDKTGQLAKDKNTTLNLRALLAFPWLKNHSQRSSMLRKLYASLSFKIFADPKYTNFNTWISNVLGHGDMLTSFSYSYINVDDPEDIKQSEMKVQVQELRAMLQGLQVKVAEKLEEPEVAGRRLGRRASKAEKLELLEEIYAENNSISNSALRKASGMGSKIINEYLKTKKNIVAVI